MCWKYYYGLYVVSRGLAERGRLCRNGLNTSLPSKQ